MYWVPNITTMLMAWLVQATILGGYVWFDKFRHPEESYDCWLIKGMRAFAFIFFTIFAFIFIDTNIKLIFGIAGYGNFTIHLASIILTFILAVEIIIGVLLVAPNRKGVITFGTVLTTFLLLQFQLLAEDLREFSIFGSKYDALSIVLFVPLFVGIFAAILLTLVEIILKKVKSDRDIEDKPFWNIQVKTKTFFSMKFNIVLWALISAEMILNLQGLSLLLWLTIFF